MLGKTFVNADALWDFFKAKSNKETFLDSIIELCEEGLEARLEVTGQFGLIAGIIFRAIDFSLKRQI